MTLAYCNYETYTKYDWFGKITLPVQPWRLPHFSRTDRYPQQLCHGKIPAQSPILLSVQNLKMERPVTPTAWHLDTASAEGERDIWPYRTTLFTWSDTREGHGIDRLCENSGQVNVAHRSLH